MIDKLHYLKDPVPFAPKLKFKAPETQREDVMSVQIAKEQKRLSTKTTRFVVILPSYDSNLDQSKTAQGSGPLGKERQMPNQQDNELRKTQTKT